MEMDFSRDWWIQKLQTFISEKKEMVSHILIVSTECICGTDNVNYLNVLVLIRAKNIDFWLLNPSFSHHWSMDHFAKNTVSDYVFLMSSQLP